jgi:hypothetical protein
VYINVAKKMYIHAQPWRRGVGVVAFDLNAEDSGSIPTRQILGEGCCNRHFMPGLFDLGSNIVMYVHWLTITKLLIPSLSFDSRCEDFKRTTFQSFCGKVLAGLLEGLKDTHNAQILFIPFFNLSLVLIYCCKNVISI